MFLFGRKNNTPAASAPLPPVVVPVPPASLVIPPPSLPVPTPVSVVASAPFTAPHSVVPASRRLQHKVGRLRRELRAAGRSLARQRLVKPKATLVLDSPLPEIAPVAAPEVPVDVLPVVPEVTATEPVVPEVTAPAMDPDALKALVATAPAFVEMQYELVDLRHQLQALQSAAAEPKVEAPPALDESAVKAVVATAPALVEMQYELVDLRHQLQALQGELAALRAAAQNAAPAAITASQLAIVDASGQVVANVSSEGVVSCSSIVFMAQR